MQKQTQPLQQRRIGPLTVSAIGLGCMNLSHAYGVPPSPEAGEALLQAALEQGITLFDTAALYGFGANESLVGRVLAAHRHRIVLASKGGMTGVDGKRVIDGRPETLKRNCEDSLRRLNTEVIDLYYLHRWDKKVPIEDSVGALAELVQQGKVRCIGLSEVSATTLRRAHAVHPIAALQTEYSLWTRNPEIAVLDACRELGTAFVAFSPLARGFLADGVPDREALEALDEKDIRRGMPRFQAQNFDGNLKFLQGFKQLAKQAGCTPGQLALAWLYSRGDDIITIPGTTHIAHLQEDVAALEVKLEPALLQALERLLVEQPIQGERYNDASQRDVDTEQY